MEDFFTFRDTHKKSYAMSQNQFRYIRFEVQLVQSLFFFNEVYLSYVQ